MSDKLDFPIDDARNAETYIWCELMRIVRSEPEFAVKRFGHNTGILMEYGFREQAAEMGLRHLLPRIDPNAVKQAYIRGILEMLHQFDYRPVKSEEIDYRTEAKIDREIEAEAEDSA